MKQGLINQVAALVADKETFNHFKSVVVLMESKEIPGAKKKALAFKELKAIGVEVAELVGNLLLELAVFYIKGLV
jgi:hypothetical protein